jgi:hypothetical protein
MESGGTFNCIKKKEIKTIEYKERRRVPGKVD